MSILEFRNSRFMQQDFQGFKGESERYGDRRKKEKRLDYSMNLRKKGKNFREVGIDLGQECAGLVEDGEELDFEKMILFNDELSEKCILNLIESDFYECPPLNYINRKLGSILRIIELSRTVKAGTAHTLKQYLTNLFIHHDSLRDQILSIFTRLLIIFEDIEFDFNQLPDFSSWPISQSTFNFLTLLSWNDYQNIQIVSKGVLNFLHDSMDSSDVVLHKSLTILSNIVTGPYQLSYQVLHHSIFSKVAERINDSSQLTRQDCSFVLINMANNLRPEDFQYLIGKININRIEICLNESGFETVLNLLKFCVCLKELSEFVCVEKEFVERFVMSGNEEVAQAALEYLAICN